MRFIDSSFSLKNYIAVKELCETCVPKMGKKIRRLFSLRIFLFTCLPIHTPAYPLQSAWMLVAQARRLPMYPVRE